MTATSAASSQSHAATPRRQGSRSATGRGAASGAATSSNTDRLAMGTPLVTLRRDLAPPPPPDKRRGAASGAPLVFLERRRPEMPVLRILRHPVVHQPLDLQDLGDHAWPELFGRRPLPAPLPVRVSRWPMRCCVWGCSSRPRESMIATARSSRSAASANASCRVQQHREIVEIEPRPPDAAPPAPRGRCAAPPPAAAAPPPAGAPPPAARPSRRRLSAEGIG